MVIFGTWDVESEYNRSVILKEEWEYIRTDDKVKRQPGYTQAKEHLELLALGYQLYTFIMEYSESEQNPDVAVIKNFERKLNKRYLKKEGTIWYAYYEPNPFPEEIVVPENYIEGAKSKVTVNVYERDPRARLACIKEHGVICKGCGFDFETTYGELGKGFIHVHHVIPLSTVGDNYILDPIKDLIPLCPNCHAMVHRGNKLLSIDELKMLILK